jgi:hypothetical protein
MDVMFFINVLVLFVLVLFVLVLFVLVLFVKIGELDDLLEFLVDLVLAEVEGELTFLEGGLPLVEVDLLAAE